MGTKTFRDSSRGEEPGGDPWAAFGYLVAGVGFYGGVGYGLSVWLNAPYLLPIGILVGVGFGFYLVFNLYRFRGEPDQVTRPDDADPVRGAGSDRDDRGDSS